MGTVPVTFFFGARAGNDKLWHFGCWHRFPAAWRVHSTGGRAFAHTHLAVEAFLRGTSDGRRNCF